MRYQGFIQKVGPWNPPPPPPEILKLSMVINVVLNNNLVPDCVRSNLRGSKLKFFLGKHAPRPTHAYTCVRVLSRATTVII